MGRACIFNFFPFQFETSWVFSMKTGRWNRDQNTSNQTVQTEKVNTCAVESTSVMNYPRWTRKLENLARSFPRNSSNPGFWQFQLVRTNRSGWKSSKSFPLFSVASSENMTVSFVFQPILRVFLDKWKTPLLFIFSGFKNFGVNLDDVTCFGQKMQFFKKIQIYLEKKFSSPYRTLNNGKSTGFKVQQQIYCPTLMIRYFGYSRKNASLPDHGLQWKYTTDYKLQYRERQNVWCQRRRPRQAGITVFNDSWESHSPNRHHRFGYEARHIPGVW